MARKRKVGRFSRIHRSKHKKGYPVGDPVRFLVLAIIHQALMDAQAGKRTPRKAVASARAFLTSEEYLVMCNFLEVRPSAARAVLELMRQEHCL